MTGIPAEAFEFYEHLDVDNSREFWIEHKSEYEQYACAILARTRAVTGTGLRPGEVVPGRTATCGSVVTRRPTRTTRVVSSQADNGLGWYLQVSVHGLMVAGGWYSSSGTAGQTFPRAHHRSWGRRYPRCFEGLPKAGFTIDGEQLKSRPRNRR